MIIYHYHPTTGVLVGTSQADASPMEPGNYLIPAHATATPPPDVGTDHQAVWVNGAWQTVIAPAASSPAPPSLDDLKDAKRAEIRALFDPEANANVTALGVTWQGGFESAIKLDAARRLAEAAGAPTVDFYDAEDVAHTLDMADATTTTIAVAAAYEMAFAKKKAAFRAIAAATTPAELDAITWSTP